MFPCLHLVLITCFFAFSTIISCFDADRSLTKEKNKKIKNRDNSFSYVEMLLKAPMSIIAYRET